MSKLLHRCDFGARCRLLALPLFLGACGGPETENTLAISTREDEVEYRADWEYESFEVDVELTLTTIEREDHCTSTGSLFINAALSEADRYSLVPTDCSLLRLTESGDIVLQGVGTGHDWTSEVLLVDTERDRVLLGPVILPDLETGAPQNVLFTLSAPPCPDNPDCDCGALKRLDGQAELSLDLGRKCD